LPEISKRQNALLGFVRSRVIFCHVGEVNVQHVEDEDFSGMTALLTGDAISGADVFGERAVSALAVLSSAPGADFTRSVSDDPCSAVDELPVFASLFGLEPKPNWFGLARHCFLISSIGTLAHLQPFVLYSFLQ
jgi:hypothetical protein